VAEGAFQERANGSGGFPILSFPTVPTAAFIPYGHERSEPERRGVDVEPPVGAALSRDISRSDEAAEAEITRFIERRSVTLKRENQQQAEEAAWAESTRKANAAREAELKAAWSAYHLDQAERHRAVLEQLIADHEGRAQELMTLRGEGPGAA
jgi:hypothetical protein